jgi:hypothetical protein
MHPLLGKLNVRNVAAAGGVILAGICVTWWLASPSLQITLVTILLLVNILLTLRGTAILREGSTLPGGVETLLQLAKSPEIASIHDSVASSLQTIASQKDPIYCRLAIQSLENLAGRCQRLANGTIEYSSTESWRVVYEELLRSPGLHLYRSVSFVESQHYWQDGPGRQSTLLNLELHDKGIVNIERIVIVADHLWETGGSISEPIRKWLDEQYQHGIWLRIVRESELDGESDLVSDFGIYGTRAVGTQLADVSGRTARFVLSFDFERVEQAEDTWKRLEVFSKPYRDILDRPHGSR